ncbi:hypothetical protein ACH5AO_36180 [Streptomyces sp. NPDC018964]|uniref:hypothetical protein n=1 Tax=Streptomyces sp. NPDC018964 TaxID=3365058 RepID=UPI0037B0BD56
MTPPDPERYPRESNEISRSAAEEQKRNNRRTYALGITVAVVTTVSVVIAALQYFDDKAEDGADEAFEAGDPLKISAGESYWGPSWYAKEDGSDKYAGQLFDMPSTDDSQPSFAWLQKHWTPLNSTGVAVNVLSKHKHTVLVQGVEITHRKCTEPEPGGALFATPPIGDGGSLEMPAVFAFNVDAPRPIARKMNTEGLPGEPSRVNVTLEKGDQREILLHFFSGTKSCTFQASLIVSSEGKRYKQRIPAHWGEKGDDAYTFRVTAPNRNHAYETRYVTAPGTDLTKFRIVTVPASGLTWNKNNQPTYTPETDTSEWTP